MDHIRGGACHAVAVGPLRQRRRYQQAANEFSVTCTGRLSTRTMNKLLEASVIGPLDATFHTLLFILLNVLHARGAFCGSSRIRDVSHN